MSCCFSPLLTTAKANHVLSKTSPRAPQLTEMGRVHLIMYLDGHIFHPQLLSAGLTYSTLTFNVIMLELPQLVALAPWRDWKLL